MLIKWTPEMSVGSSIIDAQHKVLLNQIRSLYNALLDNKTESIVKSSLSFLDTYIKSHLNYEEKYMEEHGYPGLEEHPQHEMMKNCMNDGFGFGSNTTLNMLGFNIKSNIINIHKNGLSSRADNRPRRCEKGIRRGDHLITRPHSCRHQCNQ